MSFFFISNITNPSDGGAFDRLPDKALDQQETTLQLT